MGRSRAYMPRKSERENCRGGQGEYKEIIKKGESKVQGK
jgi:hypothetical protein